MSSKAIIFRATLPQAKLFRALLDAVTQLAFEATLECSEHGLRLQTLDTAHVALVEFWLMRGAFTEFACAAPLSLGLNLLGVQKILRCGADSDALTLSADAAGERLHIELAASEQRRSGFNIKLMDLDSQSLDIPNQEPHAECVIASSTFANIIKNVSALGDTVTLEFSAQQLAFTVSGDVGEGTIELANRGDDELGGGCRIRVALPDDAQSLEAEFSLPYLTHFTRGAALGELVRLTTIQDQPLCVYYDILASSEPIGLLRYYVAPKIKED